MKKAQFNKKSIFDGSGDDDSEGENKVPNFDCSGGLRLSDSESEGGDNEVSRDKPKSKKIAVENTRSSDTDGEQDGHELKRVHDNLQKMNDIAKKLAGASKVSMDSQKENVNVADILAMGEPSASKSKPKTKSRKRRQGQSDDESDSDNWEDVEGNKRKRIKITNSQSYVDLLKRFEYVEQ